MSIRSLISCKRKLINGYNVPRLEFHDQQGLKWLLRTQGLEKVEVNENLQMKVYVQQKWWSIVLRRKVKKKTFLNYAFFKSAYFSSFEMKKTLRKEHSNLCSTHRRLQLYRVFKRFLLICIGWSYLTSKVTEFVKCSWRVDFWAWYDSMKSRIFLQWGNSWDLVPSYMLSADILNLLHRRSI